MAKHNYEKKSNNTNIDFENVSDWNTENCKQILREKWRSCGRYELIIKNRCIDLQRSHDVNIEGRMPLKINYCRRHCALLNIEETRKVETMKTIVESMIKQSFDFDEELLTTLRNNFDPEH